jgi:hypothetical protein
MPALQSLRTQTTITAKEMTSIDEERMLLIAQNEDDF